jgi:type II secretory ATPase GspE/PulE/Tfp pilus assembly ATPase PilB-like protein
MDETLAGLDKSGDVRQKALQEELKELVDVVGPGSLVDLLLERAFQLRATDIHLDPTEQGLRVRLRVDGMLHDVLRLSSDVTSHVISRLKLMANMDITERRMAQDGHFTNAALQQQRDVRVGSGPTIYGERLVLRLMPDSKMFTQLDELGLESDQIEEVKRYIFAPHGMILSVGPVGSGKSTTMYSCLEMLNNPNQSLVTIEDPVERRLGGVNQIQIDPKIDFNFVRALRGVLRQDPDVMMIGEIRDPETAHIGVRAGLTGVTVLSTVHANDAAAVIDVFREFDVPDIFVADSVKGLIAQRLLRKVCPHCRTMYRPDAAECQFLGVSPDEAETLELPKGQGCDFCFQTGYLGRTGAFEILGISGEIRAAILQGKGRNEILGIAHANGMRTIEHVAKQKVLAGVTTVAEVHRVLTSFPV